MVAEKLHTNGVFKRMNAIFKLNMRKIGVEINKTNFYFSVSLCDGSQSFNLGPVLAEICINVTSLFIYQQNKSYFENALCKSSTYSIK